MVRSIRFVSLPTISKTTLLLAALFGQAAYASGFQLFEYNSTDIGLAGAGGAAYAEDASTNFTNPAGLVNLKTPEVIGVGSIISGDSEFSGQACGGAAVTSSGGTACNLTDVHDEQGGTTNLVPAMHFGAPITDQFFVGLSITTPFGLATHYDDDTALRYSATKSEIKTIDINPNIAFKFNDHFSLGAGVSAQQMSAKLNNYVNLAPSPTPTTFSTPFGPRPGTAQYSDSRIQNDGDDWGVGWDVGALYQFTPTSRFGVSYRSEVKHELNGTSTFTGSDRTIVIPSLGVNSTTTAYNRFITQDSTEIDLPATTTVSFFQQITSQWDMMATAYYTQWHSIQNVTLQNIALFNTVTGQPQPVQGPRDVDLPQNFDNTWRFSLGTEFRPMENFTLRAGGSHDQSPVNDTDRTIRLPDADRWSAGVGAGYRFTNWFKADFGYEHVWFGDADINQPGNLAQSYGSVDTSANIYSLQGTIDVV